MGIIKVDIIVRNVYFYFMVMIVKIFVVLKMICVVMLYSVLE